MSDSEQMFSRNRAQPQGQLPEEVLRAAANGDSVAMTRVMLEIPSVNPALEAGGTGEAAMAAQTASWLADWGFETRVEEVEPGRTNVVARIGEGDRHVLLNGHLDTVGVGGMTVPPYGGVDGEGRLMGRGAVDMKSGLAAILAAAHRWSLSPGRGVVTVALTCDEEHASLGMQALVDEGVEAQVAIVAEPTSLTLMPAHKGFAWVEVAFQGVAAHGSRPDVGVDAIRHAGALLGELDALEASLSSRTPHPLLGNASFHAGTIRGGSAWSIYPEACVLTLERRTLPGEAPEIFLSEVEAALKRVQERVPDVDAALRLDMVRPASEVAVDHPLCQGLLSSMEAEGLSPRVEGMTAWVDAAFLNEAGIPAVCFGPGSIARAHSADERVDPEEIRTAARVLERFLRDYLDA